jgi:hypothetical protein
MSASSSGGEGFEEKWSMAVTITVVFLYGTSGWNVENTKIDGFKSFFLFALHKAWALIIRSYLQ